MRLILTRKLWLYKFHPASKKIPVGELSRASAGTDNFGCQRKTVARWQAGHSFFSGVSMSKLFPWRQHATDFPSLFPQGNRNTSFLTLGIYSLLKIRIAKIILMVLRNRCSTLCQPALACCQLPKYEYVLMSIVQCDSSIGDSSKIVSNYAFWNGF